jgi:hypothetical protein
MQKKTPDSTTNTTNDRYVTPICLYKSIDFTNTFAVNKYNYETQSIAKIWCIKVKDILKENLSKKHKLPYGQYSGLRMEM